MREEISNLKRAWIHHTGMQFATLLVLVASFSVISFILIFMLNLQSVLTSWGDSIRVTAYLKENVTDERIELIKKNISALKDAEKIEFVDKSTAKNLFRQQMATYAPSLLNDTEFSNPFPASVIISLKSGLRDQSGTSRLERIATELQAMPEVEDVSYGQNWVQNFSHLAEAISHSGWILISVILAGSLLIISNSIRVSIASRKEEIEILELVGATAKMIRLPFIFEAAFMGFLAMCIALITNYGIFTWEQSFLRDNLAFARLTEQILFLRPAAIFGLLVAGLFWGALSAYFTIRKMNNGWLAAEGKFE